MAYAFNALDNYFKRKKTDAGGDLQKGAGAGAPPPTAAAESLAKSAETSDEQGNAAGRFAALKGAPTGAIAQRLAAPGEAQAKSWGEQAGKSIDEYYRGGKTKIGETYKSVDPLAQRQAEMGEQPALQKVGEQLGYTGKELTFEPLQLTAPKLDTTSMLRSGISGIQAGLQKTGGRYTPGMAALDASAMAANPNAINQLQSQFGKTMESARGVQARGAATTGQLQKEAETTGTGIAGTVRGQLESRLPALQAAQQAAADAEAARLEEESKKGARGVAGIKNLASNEPVGTIAETGRATHIGEIDPRYSNLATLLGIGNITAPEAGYGMWTGTAPVAPVAPPPPAGGTSPTGVPFLPPGTVVGPDADTYLPPGTSEASVAGQGQLISPPTPGVINITGGTPTTTSAVIPGATGPGPTAPTPGVLNIGIPPPPVPATNQTPEKPKSVVAAINDPSSRGLLTVKPAELNKRVDAFYAKNGRWPTASETKQMSSIFWK